MKLAEALLIARKPSPQAAKPFQVSLACGITPLHLQTFLNAQLRVLDPGCRVETQVGLFGDVCGNLERTAQERADACAVVLEWADLDPRLGLRSLGGWDPAQLEDIAASARTTLDRLEERIRAVASLMPVAVCTPTLPFAPVAFTPTWQWSAFELQIRASLAAFSTRLAAVPQVRVVSQQSLDLKSPPGERLDVRSELASGFPYHVPHASAVAEHLARLLRPCVPKKGLITDLDDTFWSGLVGEVGAAGVRWDLDGQAQVHGLYQQLLRSLAASGVLIAVTSKNDPANVAEAFRRDDLILRAEQIFPMEVHWGLKSEAVSRVLAAWNISADSVVFIDDSPMELGEVQAAHPGMECLPFLPQDPSAVLSLLGRLRDAFGKETISDEDPIRLESLRRASAFQAESRVALDQNGQSHDEFLQQLGATLAVIDVKDSPDPRALELINKTNQFNLNGERYSEAAWHSFLSQSDSFALMFAYQDKYGPLGKVAVLAGRRAHEGVSIETWVMSCRAFSRRIEHQCVRFLFERYRIEEITLDFQPTPKNSPIREFLSAISETSPEPKMRLAQCRFDANCPPLFHKLTESLA